MDPIEYQGNFIGQHIDTAIHRLIDYAAEIKHSVTCVFNGVTIVACADSCATLLRRDWERALDHCIEGPVGPYPAAELSAEEEAHDCEVLADNQRRCDARSEAFWKKEQEKKRKLAELLEDAAPFAVADETAWQKLLAAQTSPYSLAILNYAVYWARLLQRDWPYSDDDFAEAAEKTSYLADIEGITGTMYGLAVSVLADHWKHGEQLRRWHNKAYQIGTEGDEANRLGSVLNPAMLRIRSVNA